MQDGRRIPVRLQVAAYGLIQVQPDGTVIPLPPQFGGGPAMFLYYLNNRGNPTVFGPGGGVDYAPSYGPRPTTVNYYITRGGTIMPLAYAFNIFLKYVDETISYSPDELVKDVNNWRIPIPPTPPPDTGTAPDWGGVDG